MPTVGSLFAGAGLGDIGLTRAGFEHRWMVESDPWRRKVLAKRYPGVQLHGDIKEVSGHELDRVDLIAGGFPCQDISPAGRGAGLQGSRSGLWYEMLRIVRVVRPRFVLVENSAALLGRGLLDVLGGLAESGYDAEWDIVGAEAVGAPHKRERIWIVAHAAGGEREPGREELAPVQSVSGEREA